MRRLISTSSCILVIVSLFFMTDAAQSMGRKEELHRALFDIYRQQQKYDLALAQLNALIVLQPHDAVLQALCAQMLITNTKYAAAIEHLKRATALDTTNAGYFHSLGLCYLQVGSYTNAVAALTRAVRFSRQGGQDYSHDLQLAQQYLDHEKAEQKYKEEMKNREKQDEE